VNFRGIGNDPQRAAGLRTIPIGLKMDDGEYLRGQVQSHELGDSKAPLLLSLKAQIQLGLVHDPGRMLLYSRMLRSFITLYKMRNGLHGFRID
jgi:hypothetical protein